MYEELIQLYQDLYIQKAMPWSRGRVMDPASGMSLSQSSHSSSVHEYMLNTGKGTQDTVIELVESKLLQLVSLSLK